LPASFEVSKDNAEADEATSKETWLMMPDADIIHVAAGSPPMQVVHALSGIGPMTTG
jgi:hypothetical protein